MSRLKKIQREGDLALLEQVRRDVAKAVQLPYFAPRNLRDLRDVPCAMRLRVVQRTFTNLVDARSDLAFKITRVADKIRARGPDPDPLVLEASNELIRARSVLTGRIDEMRPVRKYVERACRIRK